MPTAKALSQPFSTAVEHLNASYNYPARVPDFGAMFGRWKAQSAQVRQTVPSRLDQRYGAAPKEMLDVFLPSGASSAPAAGTPVLMFVHGGFWRALDKADQSFLAEPFVARGVSVVVPNYDLCPTVGIADIALEMAAALAFVWRNAASWGGDPNRIALVGHSAGGHLVSMLLNCDGRKLGRDLPQQMARKAMSISGLHELESIRQTPYLNVDLKLTEADALKLSPAWMPAPENATLHAVVGADESDEAIRQSQLIRAAWGSKCVVTSEELAGENHFSILDGLARPGHRVNDLAMSMLNN